METDANVQLSYHPGPEANKYCFFLEKGICALTRYTIDGHEHIYSYLKSGQLIGFFSYFQIPFKNPNTRHIILCTKTKCMLYRISRSTFENLMDTDTLFTKYMLYLVCCKYSEMNYRMHEVKDKTAPQQICGILLNVAENVDGIMTIPKFLTYSEISKYLGIHEITVTRVFAAFFKASLLIKKGRTIIIPDINKLISFYDRGATIKY